MHVLVCVGWSSAVACARHPTVDARTQGTTRDSDMILLAVSHNQLLLVVLHLAVILLVAIHVHTPYKHAYIHIHTLTCTLKFQSNELSNKKSNQATKQPTKQAINRENNVQTHNKTAQPTKNLRKCFDRKEKCKKKKNQQNCLCM